MYVFEKPYKVLSLLDFRIRNKDCNNSTIKNIHMHAYLFHIAGCTVYQKKH